MSPVAKMVLHVVLLTCAVALCASEDPQNVTVKAGENVTLQCRGPRGNITVLAWSRTDLKTEDGYVFYFRDDRVYENYQLPSYGGRVKLRDPEMKNGDVSVDLKNVTVNDTGTYECRVSARSGGDERHTEVRSSIRLKVEASGSTSGHTWEGGHKEGGHKEGRHEEGGHEEGGHKEGGHGVAVGLSVAAVVVLLVVGGFMFYRRRKGLTEEPSYQPPEPQPAHWKRQERAAGTGL